MKAMITAVLEAVLRWLDSRSGCFRLTQFVVLQDGSAWLRMEVGDSYRWYPSEHEALTA